MVRPEFVVEASRKSQAIKAFYEETSYDGPVIEQVPVLEQKAPWPKNICPDGAEHHSGFLPIATPGENYYFWLSGSRSKEPWKDPLVLWLTGGPGCSSTFASLTENGPCVVRGQTEDGRFVTERRPESWTEAANVVWVDQPVGVGFSSRPADLARLARNESQVAENMEAFLANFMDRFEHLRHVPFFVFGESFAGHYVPAVAAHLVTSGATKRLGIDLRGVGIGNGLVSPVQQTKSLPEMALTGGIGGSLGHGFASMKDYDSMVSALPTCLNRTMACQASLMQDKEACSSAYMACVPPEFVAVNHSGLNPYDLRKECEVPGLCYNLSLPTAFMNDPKVQRTIGIKNGVPWQVCNMTVTMEFVDSGDYWLDLRPQILDLLAHDVSVLVYNGDTDFMVDWVGSKRWMSGLPWPHQAEWRSAVDEPLVFGEGDAAGRVRTAKGFTFVQVFNSGHLVPMDQPAVALAMLREFLTPSSPWRAPSMLSKSDAAAGAAATQAEGDDSAGQGANEGALNEGAPASAGGPMGEGGSAEALLEAQPLSPSSAAPIAAAVVLIGCVAFLLLFAISRARGRAADAAAGEGVPYVVLSA